VTPFTFLVTAVLVVFWTVAANCLVRPTRTLALAGEMATVTGGAGLVLATDALPTAEVTAVLVACTVTVAGDGTIEGAVYRPPIESKRLRR